MTSKHFVKILTCGFIASGISNGAFADPARHPPANTLQNTQSTSELATAVGISGLACGEIQNLQRENIHRRLLDTVSGYLTAVSTLTSYDAALKFTFFDPRDFRLIITNGVQNRVRDRVLVLCNIMQDKPIAFAIQQSIVEEIAAAKRLRQL
jgi:hypothetical protein